MSWLQTNSFKRISPTKRQMRFNVSKWKVMHTVTKQIIKFLTLQDVFWSSGGYSVKGFGGYGGILLNKSIDSMFSSWKKKSCSILFRKGLKIRWPVHCEAKFGILCKCFVTLFPKGQRCKGCKEGQLKWSQYWSTFHERKGLKHLWS